MVKGGGNMYIHCISQNFGVSLATSDLNMRFQSKKATKIEQNNDPNPFTSLEQNIPHSTQK